MNYEHEIRKLISRNKRVELDKAWEVSTTRRLLVASLTYFFMLSVMLVLEMDRPFIGAIIPTLGFLLSTLGLRLAKTLWLKRQRN